MPKYHLHFTFDFKPTDWADATTYEQITQRLVADGSPPVFKGLHAWQARHQWRLEMPLGLFTNDYTPGRVTAADERTARDALIAAIRVKRFRPTDIIEHEGVTYYRKPVLQRLRDYHEHPFMIDALLAFWNAAEANRALIKPPPPKAPLLEPWERKQRDGNAWRGPLWTPDEDAVLRQWFGRRTVGPEAGRHTELSSAEWDVVLDALGRRRSQASVRQRLVVLNDRLRQEFVDRKYISGGFISKRHHEEWLDRVLGERPRPLNVRPSPRRA
jgi:hypothetical protein